jgi:uncharacterized phage protein gp47/JayE
MGPTPVAVPVTAVLTISGTTLVDVTAVITELLADYFGALAPGDTVYRNRILALITDAVGVVDCTLVAPAGNVAMLVDATHVEQATLGAVNLT